MPTMRVIVFQENGFWYAQGLEHDICVRGDDLKQIQSRFQIAVRLESEVDGGVERIAPAPKKFYDMWESKSGDYKPGNDGENFEFGMAA